MDNFKRAKAFRGGRLELKDETPPKNKHEVLDLLSKFIHEKFRYDDVADEIKKDGRHIVFVGEQEANTTTPTTLEDGTTVAYGAITYSADNHAVQTIWENQFEIISKDNSVIIQVSDWLGTTVEAWNKKQERRDLFA